MVARVPVFVECAEGGVAGELEAEEQRWDGGGWGGEEGGEDGVERGFRWEGGGVEEGRGDKFGEDVVQGVSVIGKRVELEAVAVGGGA